MARQARSLDVLLAEINEAAPNRDKASDGGIGDTAHSSRASDHNPNEAGVWRARDFDHDPAGGLDCDLLAAALVAKYHEPVVHPAMQSGAYTIWESRIYSYDRRAEGWRPYSGSNPHDKHLHQSVATSASGYDSTAPWGVMKETDDMPFSEKDLREIIRSEVAPIVKKEVASILDSDLNKNEPKGDPRFRGTSLRELLKGMATATGVVPKPPKK